jgi:hypothetical protein
MNANAELGFSISHLRLSVSICVHSCWRTRIDYDYEHEHDEFGLLIPDS